MRLTELRQIVYIPSLGQIDCFTSPCLAVPRVAQVGLWSSLPDPCISERFVFAMVGIIECFWDVVWISLLENILDILFYYFREITSVYFGLYKALQNTATVMLALSLVWKVWWEITSSRPTKQKCYNEFQNGKINNFTMDIILLQYWGIHQRCFGVF